MDIGIGRCVALLIWVVLGLAAAPREITVAAAANLTEALPEVGWKFERATGIHPLFSFSSTAQLAKQIENGAPFDVFLSADSQHVDELVASGNLSDRAAYATGVLALWIPPQSKSVISRIQDLAQPSVRVIAIARPELAPYGQATVEALTRLKLWDLVKSRVVYAGSIAMAKQYGATGNADAVFCAWPLVFREKGQVIPIDPSLHRPITQALGIVRASKKQADARAFTGFLLGTPGRQILARYGYK